MKLTARILHYYRQRSELNSIAGNETSFQLNPLAARSVATGHALSTRKGMYMLIGFRPENRLVVTTVGRMGPRPRIFV